MDKLKLLCSVTLVCFAVIGCQKRDEAAEDKTELTASGHKGSSINSSVGHKGS